ncbi:transcriptional regulator [Paenibacillus sp. FSL K6-1230]|uniref:transcriptional regulator n=1 Tax=Paenibacillus sp. FSL K6-1230 TaxID=2921603 RepID=UPI0030F81450
MQITPTIRTEIQDYLEQHKMNMSQFAAKSGLNAGTVSGIVMSNRAISVHQLDCVTQAMEKPEDYYYTRYVQEYMLEASLDWRRVKAFLQRCTELNRLDCIAQVVSVLMDNVAYYVPLVFELAEEFFDQKLYEAAEILYENVASGERNQHSERLALSQYRLFTIRIGDDQSLNLRVATLFEPYVERLDEIDQLDALKDLANVYRSLHEWDKVNATAIKLNRLAEIQYGLESVTKEPLRPLFFYVAYSNLLMGGFYHDQGNYELALEKANQYADLSWVRETDADTLHWKGLFAEWAKANILLARLMSGDTQLLSDYVEFIESKEIEVTRGLWNIMIVANRFKVDVDRIITKYEQEISGLLKQDKNEIYNQQNTDDQHIGLLYELAHYNLMKEKYEKGYLHLLKGLEKSTIINHDNSTLRFMRLFEHFRNYASEEAKVEYHNLVRMEAIV